ncbi:MAG: response regulator [Verrucomicrobiota bacterium]|jgi:CheY-like chemotaxis protein
MKKILIVEDELIVRSIYRRKFEISGYQVETAEEGTAALNLMATFKPDAVQVDIGLPGMDGVEVIRQIRAWPEFKSIPILVISSFYRPDLAGDAWKAGANKCVSKMDCTPNLALELIEQMLGGETASPFSKFGMVPMTEGRSDGIRLVPAESPWEEATQIVSRKPVPSAGAPLPAATPTPSTAFKHKSSPTLPTFAKEQTAADTIASLGVAKPDPEGTSHTTRPIFARPSAQKLAKPKSAETPALAATPPPSDPLFVEATSAFTAASGDAAASNASFRVEIRQEFLKRAPTIQAELRDRVGSLIKSKNTTDQIALLPGLESSVASLASLAGITGYSRISHLSGALDALIKDLHKKPSQMTNSVLRTIAHASDCLNMLFNDLERMPRDIPQSMLVLVVDDEPIARRTISVAMAKSNLRCIAMEDARAALNLMRENPFDLIFLDAEMPGMNGFELCGELRKLPTNKGTPVIFVTSLTKFEVRAQSSLAGANDLIAKPFLMMELAVKALTYLLKPQPIVEPKAPAK